MTLPSSSNRTESVASRHALELPKGPLADGGPRLVPPTAARTQRSPLAYWHLLSLDAPSVATLWTIFIAHCCGIALPWTAPAAMFLAVWIIYAADRLLDARQLDACSLNPLAPTDLEARHRFHHKHRSRFFAAIFAGAAALLYLLHRIDPRSLHLYVLLATLLGVWMLLIHARPLPSGLTRRLPKELAVGIFFPAAVFIPTVARSPALRPVLLPAAALFACVCTINCLYLYAWEHAAQHRIDHVSSAHSTTLWSIYRLAYIAPLVVAGLTATVAVAHHLLPIALPATACALSAAFLLLLNAVRNRISAIHLRASADLVLLTPLLLLPLLHLLST